jgi:superfamily I DNA/RNA helicase
LPSFNEEKYLEELNNKVQKILESNAKKKLIVSGPGTGKTHFFKKVIEYTGGSKEDFLVLTFINNLENELRASLGEIANVFTFHGYCHHLLRKNSLLRSGINSEFEYYPPLIKLIKSDWENVYESEPPKFSRLMRQLTDDDKLKFYLSRGNYYNAIGYDDSVYRVFRSISERNPLLNSYKLIIVDEYQDFNLLETSLLSHIIKSNPVLIVGDDDQALYCDLRDSDPKYIRKLFASGEYEKFELPFCLRCPNAVIQVFKNLIDVSKNRGLLGERIDKKFSFFPPFKKIDSEIYPNVKLVISSIQKIRPSSCNYFGRYLLNEIEKIPPDEIKESHENSFPTILIIGPTYYLRTIQPLLEENNYSYEIGEKKDLEINAEDGFYFLSKDGKSNLGWRIILETINTEFRSGVIQASVCENEEIFDMLPNTFIEEYLERAKILVDEEEQPKEKIKEIDYNMPTIRLTTFEGAKGLSAQHVFILGLQNGYLPKNPTSITDIEICRLLVALTRTKKQCQILSTNNFGGKPTELSEFIRWLPKGFVQLIFIDKNYWQNN